MEISKEDYLKAREIVLKFHNQLQLEIDYVDKNCLKLRKTTLDEFLRKNNVSSRLKTILVRGDYRDTYIEDIQIFDLEMERNCGKKVIEEFIKLRGFEY